jgi:FkbM family methyltransferase
MLRSPNSFDASMAPSLLLENNMRVFCNNTVAAKRIYKHIFHDLQYDYHCARQDPFIIDCGSNIGLSVIFFKTRCPQAKILCFEPDIHAFPILKYNIEYNNLQDVTLVNAAVTNVEGEIDFYGQIHLDSPDSRGNSIVEQWGSQREINKTIKVKAVKLSKYITSKVDLLKLNIEGAEQQVLEDLDNADKFSLIDTIFLEVHDSHEIKHLNDIKVIMSILNKHYLAVEVKFKDIKKYLPSEVHGWADKISPSLYYITARNPKK